MLVLTAGSRQMLFSENQRLGNGDIQRRKLEVCLSIHFSPMTCSGWQCQAQSLMGCTRCARNRTR
jgi:hypothetical protein